MREFKFRAYAHGKMFEDGGIMRRDGEFLCGLWNNEETDIIEPYTDSVFMQFTGLLDLHGKDIYEGDILSHRTIYGESFISVVEYGEWKQDCRDCDNLPVNCLGFYYERQDNYERESLAENKFNIIVIGNIYENPELLTK